MSPPADARTLLAQASPRGRALYSHVRRLLDELELGVPWSLLYAPPAAAGELVRRLEAMLTRLEEVPAGISGELAALARDARSEEDHEALAEAEFYFTTLHQMTAADRHRLATALGRVRPEQPATRAEVDVLCELAADVKGKYTSAIMGAAAALVSEGRWHGVEFEAELFPEKAEEAERNRRLLGALEGTARAQRAVTASFPWQPVLASWSGGRPLDRYALSDLVSLRAHLLRLLTVANRRALYSGDYQQLRRRETRLGERLREMEELHLRTLELTPAHTAGEPFDRLSRLLLEIAALLDVEVLRAQIGDKRVHTLREAHAAREGAPPGADDALSALLGEEDLRTFVDLLVGAVRKRASIACRAVEPAAASELRPAPPGRVVGPVHFDLAAGRAFATRLVAALERLTGAEHPPWKAFQMVQKLQARLGTLPPALLHEIEPFVAELETDLVPLLAEAGAAGAVPPAAADALRAAGERLRAQDFSRPEAARELAADLTRVVRLLDSLRAAAEALGAARE
jgi:hypothetical protein